MAGNLTGALSANAIKDRENATLRHDQIPILIDGAFGIQAAITNPADFYFHRLSRY
jgi:hypothetical protein